MSATFAEIWPDLYSAQTELAGEITASVYGCVTETRCIPTEAEWDRINAEDGGGEEWDGEREFQMLVSDFTARPTKYAAVTFSDDDRPAELIAWRVNNGVYYLRARFVGVPTTEESGGARVTEDGTIRTTEEGIDRLLEEEIVSETQRETEDGASRTTEDDIDRIIE